MTQARYAAITGWGEGLPPAILTNEDLSTFLDTSDEWIVQRTGMQERRISHVSAIDMATLASRRALACADLDAGALELIVYGSCSNDEQVPNCASGVQIALGATRAASMDVNTACTSFLYGLSTATAMIQTGVVKNALVIGVELISQFMDWSNRNVAVLFGDGAAAVVLQASETPGGVIGTVLGCDAEGRQTLRVRGMGCDYARGALTYGDTIWDFDGQAIFKRAVHGMSNACARVLSEAGVDAQDIDLLVPHQANLRIIESVAKYAGVSMERVMLTVQRYGNMSAATVPVALVDALREGRVKPGSLLLMPGFGGGLTYGALLVRWGDRVTPLRESDATFPPVEQSALDMVNAIRQRQDPHGRSREALYAPQFIETHLPT
ncbi:MAG TPA: ketoacyl-ACP synthase III [Gemmatimonas aurantiaca]|uniref:Beta-ketoacyl-[acyl-carrier-protein] synthase III n=2 Tax=Gemmatimonas aurantiaca TaxID=173480 RepID=C1ACI4_GEMAT|nr:ketoacyl-ACP synthase III [Gemmatimonas aurantiaca]BAH40211.1 3-oxoacyl-[acyl-carrier-protein] synthase III [Gemmatimonas aurantiaca T-27]HCT57779.1 ketoacyl-ACP synthase III [Gemmatimonas aurantiaca]